MDALLLSPRLAIALLGPLAAAACASSEGARELAVYAAASLRDALPRAAPICERAAGAPLVFNFGGSNELARQIEAGGKADVFLCADEDWMDRLDAEGLVDRASRRSILSNRLVVIGAADSPLRVGAARDLASPHVRRISLANPEAVPAGRYARAWLEGEGAWDEVERRLLPAVSVRAALAAVEAGGAEVGIVYRTDASISGRVRILFEVPDAEGPPISYSVAAMRDRPHLDAARRLAACIAGPEAREVFESFGFTGIGSER